MNEVDKILFNKLLAQQLKNLEDKILSEKTLQTVTKPRTPGIPLKSKYSNSRATGITVQTI